MASTGSPLSPAARSVDTPSAGDGSAWRVEETDAWWAEKSGMASSGVLKHGADAPGGTSTESLPERRLQYQRPIGAGRITMLEKQMKVIADQVGAGTTLASDECSGHAVETVSALTPQKPKGPPRPVSSPPKGSASHGRRFGNTAQQQETGGMVEERATLIACETHTPGEVAVVRHSAHGHAQCKTITSSDTDFQIETTKALEVKPELFPDVSVVMNAQGPFEPLAVAKALEMVVSHQIEGLGECLNICAQRSRTLKLLGFHHLHFDARLQSFLESKSYSLGGVFLDILLMARALLGFREVTRQSFMWQRIRICQQRLHREAVRYQQISKRHKTACHRGRSYLLQLIARSIQAVLECCFLGWVHTLAVSKFEKIAKDGVNQANRAVASVQRRAVKKVQASDDHTLIQDIWHSFRNYVSVCKAGKEEKEAHLNRVLRSIADTWLMVMAQAFHGWLVFIEISQDQARRKATTMTLIDNLVAEQEDVMALNTAINVIHTWHQIARCKKRKAKQMLHAIQTVAKDEVEIASHCFRSWGEELQRRKLRYARQRRVIGWVVDVLRICQLAIAERDKRLLPTAFEIWHNHAAGKNVANKRAHRQIRDADERLVAAYFTAWSREQLRNALASERAKRNGCEASRKIGVGMLDGHLARSQQQVIALYCDAWSRIARSARLHRQQRQTAQQYMMRQIGGAGLAMQSQCFQSWARESFVEKQHRMHTDLRQEETKNTKEKLQAKAIFIVERRRPQVLGRCCLAAWSQLVAVRKHVSDMMEMAQNYHDKSDSFVQLACFISWRGVITTQDRERIKERSAQQASGNRLRVLVVMERKVADVNQRFLQVCICTWLGQVKQVKKAKEKKDQTVMAISKHIAHVKYSCFSAWLVELCHSKLLKLRELKINQEMTAKDRVTEGLLREFALSEKVLVASCWKAWNGCWLRAKHKEETVLRVLGTIARAENALIGTSFKLWMNGTSLHKLEARNRAAKENNMRRVERHWLFRRQLLYELCFSVWTEVVATKREQTKKKSQSMEVAEKRIGGIKRAKSEIIFSEWEHRVRLDRTLAATCFGYQKKIKTEKGNKTTAVGKSGDLQDLMLNMILFNEWRHMTRLQKSVDGSLRITREKAVMVMGFLGEGHGHVLIHLCFGKWHFLSKNMILKENIKERNIANIRLMVDKPLWAALSRILATWHAETVASKAEEERERALEEAQRIRQEQELEASVTRYQKKRGRRVTVAKAMDSVDDMYLRNAFKVWRMAVMARTRQDLKTSAILQMTAAVSVSQMLAFLHVWRVETVKLKELHENQQRIKMQKNIHWEHVVVTQGYSIEKEADWFKRLIMLTWKFLLDEATRDNALLDSAAKCKVIAADTRYYMLLYAEAQNGGVMLGHAPPVLLLVAWLGVAKVQRLQNKLRSSGKIGHYTIIGRARQSAERLKRLALCRAKARLFSFWRVMVCMQMQYREDAKMHARCHGNGRALVIKLADRLCKLRFFYRFLWLCQPKPREIEFPSSSRRTPDFSKEPPAFFVRPVSADRRRWPITYVPSAAEVAQYQAWEASQNATAANGITVLRPGPENRPAEQRSAAGTAMLADSEADPESQVVEQPDLPPGASSPELHAGERFSLAAKASTSDMEYRRLFEHNRREIREGRLERESPGVRVKSWGVWMA